MALQCGIVGLPNAGKSTIFNALTASRVPAESYPFCTIDPNVGVVPVPDERLEVLARIYQPKAVTPATVEFVDIAGLVRGAHRGEGLGNQFLARIREVEAVIHVVRCFEDPNISHVEGNIDPVRDAGIVATELLLKDLETVDKRMVRVAKGVKTGDPESKAELPLLKKVRAGLNDGHTSRSQELNAAERAQLGPLFLLTMKPVLYVANVDEEELAREKRSPGVQALFDYAARENNRCLRLGGRIEEELAQLEENERADFAVEYGLHESGLARLIHAAYDLLDYLTFFTGNPNELRAWTLVRGATAWDAAGLVHTDFQKGFIKAEVMKYDDLERLGSLPAVREAGTAGQEGKEYVVQDGDVILFRFNV